VVEAGPARPEQPDDRPEQPDDRPEQPDDRPASPLPPVPRGSESPASPPFGPSSPYADLGLASEDRSPYAEYGDGTPEWPHAPRGLRP
jgi:hypothetical protein